MRRVKWWYAAAVLVICCTMRLSEPVRNPFLTIQVIPGFTGVRWSMAIDAAGNRELTIGPRANESMRLLPPLNHEEVARLLETVRAIDIWSFSHSSPVTDQPTFVLRAGQREIRVYDPRDLAPGPARARFSALWNEVLRYVPYIDGVSPAEYRMIP